MASNLFEKQEKIASGLRLIKNDIVPQFLLEFGQILTKKQIIPNGHKIDQYSINCYFASDSDTYCFINGHTEFGKFKWVGSASFESLSGLSLQLNNNTTNGVCEVDLEPGCFIDFDS